MKASKYNYIIPFGEKYIFFNGITEKFFLIPKHRVETYRKILDYPEENKEVFESFLDKMQTMGFVLNDKTDEMDSIRCKFEALRVPYRYFLMVLPTYECNLRCWYCIQKHADIFMNDEILNNTKQLIKRKLSDDSITDFHLSWFGGEPLLAYDKIIDLTVFARDYAKEKGKTFSSAITTNGTLLTPERIEELRHAGVINYQITIDGDRSTHNSVKKLGKISAYDRTLGNINLIARHTHVNLRFNYTHENFKPYSIIEDLKSKIDPEVLGNISFTITKVWQEDQRKIKEDDVDILFNLGKENGLRLKLLSYGLCYTDFKHFDCVFPNGHVGKCDNKALEEMSGILQNDGTIVWKQDMREIYRPHVFDDIQNECRECRYLPVCWGPCVVKRERMLTMHGNIGCTYGKPGDEIERLIVNACKNVLQATK